MAQASSPAVLLLDSQIKCLAQRWSCIWSAALICEWKGAFRSLAGQLASESQGCQVDHLAGVACQKTCRIRLCLGSNRYSRNVRQRTTAERSILLRPLFSGRMLSIFISVVVVETHQILVSFNSLHSNHVCYTAQIESVNIQFCIALPDVTDRTENCTGE